MVSTKKKRKSGVVHIRKRKSSKKSKQKISHDTYLKILGIKPKSKRIHKKKEKEKEIRE